MAGGFTGNRAEVKLRVNSKGNRFRRTSRERWVSAAARRFGPLTNSENFLHVHPPFAFGARLEGLLARAGELHTMRGDGIGRHFARVRREIFAMIFPIGEEEILGRAQKD